MLVVRVRSPFRSISVGAVNVTFLGDERQSRFLFALDRRSMSMLDRRSVSMLDRRSEAALLVQCRHVPRRQSRY